MRPALMLVGLLSLAGCGSASDQAGERDKMNLPGTAELEPPPAPSPQQAAQLGSRDCGEVVELYLEALGGRDYALAARVWDDPAVDAARLESVFGGYNELQVEWTDPFIEGAAGSLYCTVAGKLTDAQDRTTPPIEGTLLLRRVNDVPGATPEQLRWTLRSSTFVEQIERPDGTEP